MHACGHSVTTFNNGKPIVRGIPEEIFEYALPDEPRLADLPPPEERQGPRNLDFKFANTRVKGIISVATAYLTSLCIAKGAVFKAPEEKRSP